MKLPGTEFFSPVADAAFCLRIFFSGYRLIFAYGYIFPGYVVIFCLSGRYFCGICKKLNTFSGGRIFADFKEEIRKRRTFAIISHPDAGKTTLTEKLLLYGCAIYLAGSIKSRRT